MSKVQRMRAVEKTLEDIYEELRSGKTDDIGGLLQRAVYAQVNINRIVWWLNEQNNGKRNIDWSTIDPVVHGEWIDFNMSEHGVTEEKCGVCGQWSYGMGKRYCPHCGAKNGGEQRYEDEFDVCDSRNGCGGCEHHICKLEQTDERSE